MADPVALNSSVQELFRASRSGAGSAAPERTGRYIVTWKEQAAEAGHRLLSERAGLPVFNAADSRGTALSFSQLPATGALLLPNLNIAVVHAEPDQMTLISSEVSAADSPILAIDPEYFVYAATTGSDYVQGFRDGVESLAGKLTSSPQSAAAAITVSTSATWGLAACQVPRSRFTGRGIRVAVLDTGMDLNHPDFSGRQIVTSSFINGQQVQDVKGHGTHCIGTACGPVAPPIKPPRYGIAGDSLIFAGKVLDDTGAGTDATILAGIDWALSLGCQIVSMSLARRVQPSEQPQQAYESAGARALDRGTLLIAAAGNDSMAPLLLVPVSSPANASTIFAVAAVGEDLTPSSFSNSGINTNGGEVNMAAPGENVLSTVPMPLRYGLKTGTSMATPHVAGIAALWAESDASLRGRTLWKRLESSARDIAQPKSRVGAGLVQAP